MTKILIATLLLINTFNNFAQQPIELNNWKFQTGDYLEWAKPAFDATNWKPIVKLFGAAPIVVHWNMKEPISIELL